MKKIYLFLLALVFSACKKDLEEYRSFVYEYPSKQPMEGVSLELGYQMKTIGTFLTDAQGLVVTKENPDPYLTKVLKSGYRQINQIGYKTADQSDNYYLARPSWVELHARNVAPMNGQDECSLSIEQYDSLSVGSSYGLSFSFDRLFFEEWEINQEKLTGTGANKTYWATTVGGVYAKLVARVTKGGAVHYTSFAFFCPPNDTTLVNFEY